MFDRSRTDTSTDAGGITVEITLTDGQVINGKMLITVSKTPADVLNGPGTFIEAMPFGGARQFIAKTSIKTLRVIAAPKATLGEQLRDLDGFDPYRILDVTEKTPWDDVRHAYIVLSKGYHPDRFATVELPEEVKTYLAAMARRINAAFEALEDGRVKVVRKAERVQPIYQTPARN
jgi:hypothetical protein